MSIKYDIAAVNTILPKLFRLGVNLKIAQSRFYKKMNQVKESNKINPGGVFTPYTIQENDTAFGVPEGGAILGGSAPEHVIGQAGLRSHWSSMSWTGRLERIQSQHLATIQRDARFAGASMEKLQRIALNKAVEEQVASTMKMFAERDNFFALQGTDKSSIGVVTDIPAALGGGAAANTVHYSWDSTPMGNRHFSKNQMIQHYSGGGILDNGLTGKNYSVVDQKVDKTADSGVNGPVHYDEVPTDLVVGATAHFRNAYAEMPVGFMGYVDDTGNFNGQARSADPDALSSVVIRLTGSPTIGPAYLRELDSLMESKNGYGIPIEQSFWFNKTQKYNFESVLYGTPFVRQVGAGKVGKIDLAPAEMEWDGKILNIDKAVPPDGFFSVNFMSWEKITQTPLQPYPYHSGDYVVNPMNSNAEYLDVRQSTVFTEYNWVCWDARPNGRIEGFSFNRKHI